jgi:D-alanyl-D-alanine carboxypeptidase
MMTLYVLFEDLEAGRFSLDSKFSVSAKAAAQAPSNLGLKAGATIEVEDAIQALTTKSANDASVVVAENVSGSVAAFAERMNRTARSLGMNSSHFRNPNGLPDPGQTTTARDFAKLGAALQDRFPRYYKYFGVRTFTYKGQKYRNHNKLLGSVEGVDGIKTGYIRASGFNLVSNVRRGNKHIIAVVMGGKTGASRDAHMRELIAKYLPAARAESAPPLSSWRRAPARIPPRGEHGSRGSPDPAAAPGPGGERAAGLRFSAPDTGYRRRCDGRGCTGQAGAGRSCARSRPGGLGATGCTRPNPRGRRPHCRPDQRRHRGCSTRQPLGESQGRSDRQAGGACPVAGRRDPQSGRGHRRRTCACPADDPIPVKRGGISRSGRSPRPKAPKNSSVRRRIRWAACSARRSLSPKKWSATERPFTVRVLPVSPTRSRHATPAPS